ncbi:DUF4886 domain-containing protein [Robiginitalea sp. SC105]|uniref:DUF4886 domain-containing protein n=1 Tax=Robiginitalea sp. SC105 TaxID=2762332 RepID=UPI00163AFEB6|nr:DUF4886 domain-containing protein [Robiginitalea sp. SC105]MBC2839384.1 DUF4886 domain-containing protein [Robiginitalea sp. SC105]
MKNLFLFTFWVLAGMSAQGQPAANADSTHVLFVGNSLTYYHDMPQMLQAMLAEGGHTVRIHQSTVPGMSLRGHLDQIITRMDGESTYTRPKMDGEITGTENALREREWDVVVLQEGTVPVMIPEARAFLVAPAIASSKAYLNAPCRFILFNTWAADTTYPRRYCYPSGLIDASLPDDAYCSGEFGNLSEHTRALNAGYEELAKAANMEKSNHGDLFERIRNDHGEIDLFDDAFHPSAAGAFLNACEFYYLLTGSNPTALEYTGPLDADQAQTLKRVVDRYHQ